MGLKNCGGTFSIKSIAKGLRKREGWKYVKLATYLVSLGIRHQFEFVIDNYSFDLALLDNKLLIEFDGSYHRGSKQLTLDNEKTATAVRAGYKVERIVVYNNVVIPVKVVQPFTRSLPDEYH